MRLASVSGVLNVSDESDVRMGAEGHKASEEA